MSRERFKSLKEMQNEVDADIGGTVNPKELLRLELLTSFEKYTKAMFKAQYHRSFIVAEHHKKMFSALQDVVDGGLGTTGLGDELGLLSVELTGNLRHGLRGSGSGSGLLLLLLFYR